MADPTQKIRGLSPLHDSGTGSSLGTSQHLRVLTDVEVLFTGTYGNFEIMPLLCPNGFDTCTTTILARERLRKLNTDGLILQISIEEPIPDICLAL